MVKKKKIVAGGFIFKTDQDLVDYGRMRRIGLSKDEALNKLILSKRIKRLTNKRRLFN